MSETVDTEVVVLGSGPAGYSAAFRAADLGLDTVLVERYPSLGGVCLNVGCIPSKALLHLAKVIKEAKGMSSHGINFGNPTIDLKQVRQWKDEVVGQLTKGLDGMAKQRKARIVTAPTVWLYRAPKVCLRSIFRMPSLQWGHGRSSCPLFRTMTLEFGIPRMHWS